MSSKGKMLPFPIQNTNRTQNVPLVTRLMFHFLVALLLQCSPTCFGTGVLVKKKVNVNF